MSCGSRKRRKKKKKEEKRRKKKKKEEKKSLMSKMTSGIKILLQITYSNLLLLYINNCKTVRCSTLNTLACSLVDNNATSLEIASNYVSTSL